MLFVNLEEIRNRDTHFVWPPNEVCFSQFQVGFQSFVLLVETD